ncbi:MAG: sigma-54 dependent transcriptional regulator, partial [Desulfuromonadales bacterium]|nr:sigma-54 dependent transcriptional regulator [Desulfuromonadales bacterium]
MNAKSYPSFAVLLVDDEPAWLRSLPVILERNAGITNVLTCPDSRQALGLIEQHNVGLVLLDHTMPHLSGEELLRRIAERHPQVITIVISGLNQLETAVQCMKHGAFDYFVKTVEEDRLISGILRAVRMLELQQENRAVTSHLLSGELNHPEAFGEIVTCDRAMQTIFAYIEAVAPSPQPLLITGESGVGKELIARVAHRLSGQRGALVAVNVAGLDDTVFADTLFGHVRGAFTGADQARRGMVEEAADGTLFLDEIGDLGISSQIKLLRLLQEGEYFPLGSDRPKRLRARVIVATHGDLAAREAAGTFRRDLYYRLRTHSVHVPALRERKGDIPLLLNHFLGEAARSLGKKKPTPPKELAQLLAAYSFPG